MKGKKGPLMRDPADWARDWGWVSRRRAVSAADRLRGIAEGIRDTMGEDDVWARELEAVAKYLAPAVVPAERKRARREAVSS